MFRLILLVLWSGATSAQTTNLSRPYFDSDSVADVTGNVENDFQISPDSRFVVFVGDFDNDDRRELYRAMADGSGTVRLDAGGDFDVDDFQISPDSRYVIFEAEDLDTEDNSLFATALNESEFVSTTNLNNTLPDELTEPSVFAFEILDDGSRVVFSIIGTEQGALVIQIGSLPINRSGDSVTTSPQWTPLANGDFFVNPVGIFWSVSPVTHRLVYNQFAAGTSGQFFGLFSIPVIGDQPTQLSTFNVTTDAGDVIEAGLSSFLRDISADGQTVLYSQHLSEFDESEGRLNLYATSIDADRRPRRLNDDLGDRFTLGFNIPGIPLMNTNGSLAYHLLNPTDSSIPLEDLTVGDLYVSRTSGNLAQRQLINQSVSFLQDIVFHPNDSRLIYTTLQGNDLSNPSSVNLFYGGDEISILPSEPNLRFVKKFQLAQDGSRLIFVSGEQLLGGIDHLYAYEFSSRELTLLTSSPEPSPFFTIATALTPNAQTVVFAYPPTTLPTGGIDGIDDVGSMDLFAVPVTGGAITPLNPPLTTNGVINPNFIVSPNSGFVVYRANIEDETKRELLRSQVGPEDIFLDGFEAPL